MICAVAEAVGWCIRSSDMLFRYGGEEFAVILNNTGPSGTALLAELLRQMVERVECVHSDSVICFTGSVGVEFLEDMDDDERLFKKADDALYQVKAEGRNRAGLAA